jgi:hypothetical protein
MTPGTRSERRLIQLLCGTQARREQSLGEMSHLVSQVDGLCLVDLLKRVNLLVLVGNRLHALGFGEVDAVARELNSFSHQARRWGVATELASLEVLDRLTTAGIRALPLKGSLLARELYGDVGTRTSMDIDILVALDDLQDAVTAVSELGWRWEPGGRRIGGLPILHETLRHPMLPRVELHWRLHWYERRFAADALSRAQQSAAGGPLGLQPLDGLIALLLFYARDGFSGLRYPSDVAAWWDRRCLDAQVPSPVQFVAECYPALAAPVAVAAGVLTELVGLPVEASSKPPFRWRLAAGLTSPFVDGGRHQAEANAALADLLLAPPCAAGEAVRRILQNAPVDPSRQVTWAGATWAASAGHVIRVLRRWALALIHSYALRRPVGYQRALSRVESPEALPTARPTRPRHRRSR